MARRDLKWESFAVFVNAGNLDKMSSNSLTSMLYYGSNSKAYLTNVIIWRILNASSIYSPMACYNYYR